TLPIRYLVLVSASFGSINLAFNQIDTFWEEPGAARVQTEQLIPETGISSDLAYRLPNHANPPGATYNSHHTADLTGTGSSTLVCSTPPTALTGAGSCDGTGSATRANAAHYFAYNTVNYYDSHHQRNSINNAGLNLISNVDYREEAGIPYENAYWDGTQMVYGDGDVFTVDDVIGHELSHGVTQYESNLFYFYESGAMNEMFSDIFGEFTDQWNGINSTGGTESVAQKWLIGEDMSIGAMRNMANPPSGSPAQPDRTQSGLYFQGTGDNGGVHYNSGVGNKAAYLLAVGGTFNGYTITALGNDKTSAIFYEVNTTLLTSGAEYNVLGVALVQACNNIRSGANPLGITAADCTEVDEAVHATEMHIDPVASIDWTPSAALCPTAGDVVTEALFSTTFEGDGGATLAGFTDGVIINPTTMPTTSAWQEAMDTGVPYAISGVRSAFGVNHPGLYGASNSVDYDAFTRLTSAVALPAGSAYYLYFDHAFGFEQWEDFFGDVWEPDGGVLEYSTAGSGGPWTDAGALFQAGQNYNGVVESDTGMAPLEGRSAFIVDSHGYVSSRYNLTSLAGQNVWFRWRIGGDSFGYLGWWLDNVQIYRCAPSAPEIAAEGHSATPISDGGTYNMGTTPLGTALVRTITVRNVGSLPLTISTNPPTITGDFTAGNFGTTTIAGGSSTTFSLTCNASTLGSPVVGTVSFGNNDSNENPFNFTVNCTVTAPEIAVEGHSATAINDGGIYEMGTTPLGEPLVRTITVRNTGTATLSITTNPPTVTGNFTAGTFAATSIAAGTSTTFNLTCTAAALGSPIEGTVSFANNDANENPFNFTVRCNVASPEIEVRAPDDSLINDGGTYSLGSTTLGVPITQTIRVNSIGSDPVIISDDPPIVSTGFSAGNFGSTTIAAGDFTTFDLTCDATAGGSPVTGTVSFGNNDTNENPFNFTVTCTVTAPEIEVRSPDNTLISDGSLYHLGSTPMGVPLTRIITVKNTGTGSATLILSSTAPTVTGPYSAGNFGSTAIAPGFSTTFDLTCNATIAGTNVSGNLSFGNNDTNENPFNFMVACNVTVPEIAVEGHLAVAINDNGSYDLGTTSLSQPLTRTITVHNTGGAPLTISTNPPTVTGDFSAGNFGSLTVAAGSSTTFDLTCNASALGTANGTVSFGNSDSNENPFNFSIACTTIVPLDPPALLLPADGILTNDNTPVLSWSPVTNAQSYNYAISEAADMSGAVQLGTTSETTYTADPVLDDDTTYYWHVRAVGPGGTTTSAWSETRSFTVDLLRPAVPVLSSPKDRSNTTDTTPKFSWSKPSGTTQFHLEVDDDPTFGTPINLGATLFLTNSYTVPTLNALPYGGYYWRVQAGNAAGLWSDWSVVRRFTITLLKAPANTAHITDTTPTFSWTKPTGALAFEFQLDNNENLGSPEIGPIGTGTNATFTPAAVLLPGQYWWSVRVQTINGWSAWMPAWTLTITAPPNVKPTLDQPANGAILADTTPDFHWGTVPDGHHYQIQIDNTSNFSSPAQDMTLAAGLTNYTAAPPLPDGGKYYWRVRAINATGVAGAWSSTSNFTLAQLAAPTLLLPTNKFVTADTTPAFGWNGVAGASSYTIQISTDANFVTVNHQGSAAGTSYTVPDPSALPAGVYNWRVQAINGSGVAGKWSSKRTFTVDLVGPAAPVLSSPALYSGTPDTTPTFKWAASSGAKLYRIQVTLEDDYEFDDPIFTETSTTTSYTPLNPLAYEFYVWRVQAQDAVGNWGPYSPL
ncbi:MAG: choice-of-anchor D domain-containing protein, partial [Chloroflexi bacterium]|nr:choice-of-anchor D domain-containing protein [Chloroflexota bacterium]